MAPPSSEPDIGPTATAQRIVELVSSHTRMLVGTKDSYGIERNQAFRAVELKLQEWARKNKAIYSPANIFGDGAAHGDIDKVLESHRQAAKEGIRLLFEFDYLEMGIPPQGLSR